MVKEFKYTLMIKHIKASFLKIKNKEMELLYTILVKNMSGNFLMEKEMVLEV